MVIDHIIIENINKYTETKVLRVLGTAVYKELYAFVDELLYMHVWLISKKCIHFPPLEFAMGTFLFLEYNELERLLRNLDSSGVQWQKPSLRCGQIRFHFISKFVKKKKKIKQKEYQAAPLIIPNTGKNLKYNRIKQHTHV